MFYPHNNSLTLNQISKQSFICKIFNQTQNILIINMKPALELEDKLPDKPQKQKEINWNDFNYPPLIKLMHFRPSELPKSKKPLVMMAFIIHIIILINTILSIVDNIAIGGLNILYSILFFFIFNPIILFLFYRCYIGLCKEKSKLSLYTYIQPLIVVLEIVISIIDFIGFNGFIKVNRLYNEERVFQATLALIISVVYLVVALLSSSSFIDNLKAIYIFQFGKSAHYYPKL